jgi:superfamily II DNA/RNA helicase
MISSIQESLAEIKSKEAVKISTLEKMLIETYRLLDSEDENHYNLCLSSICHVANINHDDVMVQQLLHDCIIKSRIFLYDGLLESIRPDYSPHISAQDSILQNFYTSRKTNTTLTKPQKEVFDLFQKDRRLIVSAPTSFGKTRIVREIISSNDYRKIALIMPTVSLLSEQYQDIKKNIEGYTIVKSSKVKINEDEKYILVLTPERMSAFLDENPTFKIDFFVMDEIYKTDYKLNDDRYKVFSDILYRLSKQNTHFYLIGPYISDFSEKFREKFRVTFKKFELEIVQKDYYKLDKTKNKGAHIIENGSVKIIGDPYKNLHRIISQKTIDGKFLIYRYQKKLVEETAKKLALPWSEKPYNEELVDYLSQSVSADWDLISCIKKGIAFHHGAMPRHIQDLIVDEFNDSSPTGINYLFCTTSLTEGINSAAKNVVIYDKKIGRGETLGTLDRKNIEGRAGRFMQHFIGRVFYLETDEKEDEESIVEIEYLDKPRPAIESLLQLDSEDIPEDRSGIHSDFITQIEKLRIPESLIKSNRFVSVDGQISLIQHLRRNSSQYYFGDQYPEKPVQTAILSTIYDYLFTENDKGRNFGNEVGKSILIQLTNYYAYLKPSFRALLESDTIIRQRKEQNSRIRYVFDLCTKYFEFVWPKYIKAFENIYNFTANEKHEKHIKLDMLVAQLEYGTTKPHEIILRDSGLPNEIIGKISNFFKECKTFDEVQQANLKHRTEIKKNIHSIESRVLDKYI